MVRMAGVGPEWSHSMAHGLALDARTWPRGDVPGLGLIDEDVDLLRGSSRKNSEVKRAWLGAILGWVTDREVLPRCVQACGPGLKEAGRYNHEEEETNEYELQRLKIIAANQQIFRSLGLPGTLNGDSSNKALQVPKGRGQKRSTQDATSPVTGGRGSKGVLPPPQEVTRITRQRARELSAANPVEETQEDRSQRKKSERLQRAGKDLERINKGMHMKLPIHISEGKKRPEVPRQVAKLAADAGIVLRRHIPVLPRWNKLQHEQDHLSNYIKKVQFPMDTTSKPVISVCADMLKFGQRQMRYKLKKKYFDNVPESQRITKSPVSSMDDNQWAELLKLWSSPQHKETCVANQQNPEKVRMYQRTGSRCYVAQAHAVRDKLKNAEPTAVDLFREFHSSRKTGSVSETVQEAL
ncbi:hypothetical protein EJB05_56570, partial [Eragrostis curvula]